MAVRRGVQEGAVVVLPVDLHKRLAELPQQRRGDRPVVDESLCAPILMLDAPEDEQILAIDVLLPKEAAGRM
jgi:hypothetical protein